MKTRAITTALASETTAEPRPVLSVAEAAQLLGVSEWLVLQQTRLGSLPHKRCGRRIVFSRERLMEWLNDR
jgi:excisionase family DNA binding protein